MQPGSAFLVTAFLALDWVLSAIQWLVLVWVILSWILFFTAQSSFRWRYKTAFGILVQLNELASRAISPLLRPFRRLIPASRSGGIDWSPMLLLLAIYCIRTFVRLAFGPILFR